MKPDSDRQAQADLTRESVVGLASLGLSPKDVAKAAGISRQHVHRILVAEGFADCWLSPEQQLRLYNENH